MLERESKRLPRRTGGDVGRRRIPAKPEERTDDARPAVVLLGGEPVTRMSLRRLLEEANFDVRGEADDADTAIDLCLRERPALCLVDLNIGGGGTRVVRELSRRIPEAVVVGLSDSPDRNDVIDVVRAGASGYLLKSMDPNRIPDTLRGALAGEAAIPRVLVTQLVRDLQTLGRHRSVAGRNGSTELTRREWEILELMCEGVSGPGIARRLNLSPVTVRRHSAQAVRKLGVRDRDEAIALLREES